MEDTIRINYTSRDQKEKRKGFSKAVKCGPFIEIGGITAKMENGEIYGMGDTYSQLKYILEKQIQYVISAGAGKHDVYRVRIFTSPDYNREEGEKAFGEVFGDARPMLSVIGVYELSNPRLLCKVEMSACEGAAQGTIWHGMLLKKTAYDIPETENKPYCAMIKVGPFVYSGTKAVEREMLLSEMAADPIMQDDIIYDLHLKLLNLAGVQAEDVIKIDSFVLPQYRKVYIPKPYSVYAKKFQKNKPLHTTIYVSRQEKENQLVAHEIFGIVGCGRAQNQKPEEWGELDLHRENYMSGTALEESNGFSRIIKAGPFIYSGGTTAVKADGSVVCEADAIGQESAAIDRLLEVLEPLGVKPVDVITCRAYRSTEYKKYETDKSGTYDKVLKPVKPVYTGIYTREMHKKSQLVEFEIQAIQGNDTGKVMEIQL